MDEDVALFTVTLSFSDSSRKLDLLVIIGACPVVSARLAALPSVCKIIAMSASFVQYSDLACSDRVSRAR